MIRRILFENFWLKVAAVSISVLLWFFATSRGQTEVSLEIPLELRNIPVGLGIAKSSAKEVFVSVRGQDRAIRDLTTSHVRAYVDLSKAQKGENMFHVLKDTVMLPPSLTVTKVTPLTVNLNVAEVTTKVVLVDPSILGVPRKGYSVKSILVKPRSVKISGLISEVNKLRVLRTEDFDITGLTETISEELRVNLGEVNVNSDKTSVLVTITIEGDKR